MKYLPKLRKRVSIDKHFSPDYKNVYSNDAEIGFSRWNIWIEFSELIAGDFPKNWNENWSRAGASPDKTFCLNTQPKH